jgi:hypothetical protein
MIIILRVLVLAFAIAGAWNAKCGTRGVEVTPPLSNSSGTSLLGLQLAPVAHAFVLHYRSVLGIKCSPSVWALSVDLGGIKPTFWGIK